MALYREELDAALRSSRSSCHFHSPCHPTAPTWVYYENGELVIACCIRKCGQEIARIAVARGAEQEEPEQGFNGRWCPYWRKRHGASNFGDGMCAVGSTDEPECMTCEPAEVWPPLPEEVVKLNDTATT